MPGFSRIFKALKVLANTGLFVRPEVVGGRFAHQQTQRIISDFRNFGFRILSDVIVDLDDMYVAEEKNAVRTDTDSELVNDIMEHYLKGRSHDYGDLAASRTRLYMNERIDPDTALKCAVALKAWCSLPDGSKPKKDEHWKDKTCFPELHTEFPELVNEDGEGGFYTHVHNVIEVVLDYTDGVYPTSVGSAIVLTRGFDNAWREKVIQYQASLYSVNTKGWVRRFADIIAEAKEEGPLQNKDFELPAETVQKLKDALNSKKRENVIIELAKYYIANTPEDSDWVILPVDSFNAYFGTTSFDRKWLPDFPEEIIERMDYAGLCRFKMFI